MNLLGRTRETFLPERRLLDSRTPGVPFEMTGSARWRPRRTSHPKIEAVIRDAVYLRARPIAAERYADDIRGAEDAINAELGAGHHQRSPYYSTLVATVTLRLSDPGMTSSLEYRQSLTRIERLRLLKRELYSDPSMLLLDYLDRDPGKLAELPDLARFQQLALKISNGERWWCRALDILDKLSSQVSDENGNLYVMTVLFTALQKAAPDILGKYQEELTVGHYDLVQVQQQQQ